MKLEFHILLRLCLNGEMYRCEAYKMYNVTKEGLSMCRMTCKGNDSYVQGVFRCTHTHT